jgi:hypothetical protein
MELGFWALFFQKNYYYIIFKNESFDKNNWEIGWNTFKKKITVHLELGAALGF